MTSPGTTSKRKLIEVALPLEVINRESAREKSIRHGHPSTLHLWWARRPLAACRAVLFSQLVDDPSAHPDQFPTEEAQAKERQRLFAIIERLVVWENINDESLLREAHEEILKSTDGIPPIILDPFAGGGSIPLEAQRLGLESHASDINPVAVLINRALIEIPPKWANRSPVFTGSAATKISWPKATGLAEDIRRYGEWIRDEAEKRIGSMYPKATLSGGTQANVIAWIWARTVKCPNPACAVRMPLVRSWWLGKKKGKEAYIVPAVGRDSDNNIRVEFSIGHEIASAPKPSQDGTVGRNGASCVACGTSVPLSYIRDQGRNGNIGAQMIAVVAEGNRRRHYLPPTSEQVLAAAIERPTNIPETELPVQALGFRVQGYGMTHHADLFTNRQLVALMTLSDLVGVARGRITEEAIAAGRDEPVEYANDVAVYLGFAMSRLCAAMSSLNTWNPATSKEGVNNVFKLQTLSMVWDFAESNPFKDRPADMGVSSAWTAEAIMGLGSGRGQVEQADASTREYANVVVATDPPYYDNVPYADLSDFFYVWLRRTIEGFAPSSVTTVLTPKADELIADPFRHGSSREAERFFEDGFGRVFARIRQQTNSDSPPITVFYAFKQSESDEAGISSTGWQTLLEGMIRSGWEITATWPMRTERPGRPRDNQSNALASSIVLALRPRSDTAETILRRTFVQKLSTELPTRLRELQQGSIAPVDMAQAAIGPGMGVFSRHARVLEADGSDMTVRTALALINQALDEVLSEQEGDFDAETRFAVKWFSQFGWNEGASGEADVLTRAVNTTLSGLERGGIFRASAGKARLLEPSEMSVDWSPAGDKVISVWEVAVRLGHALMTQGADQAAMWMRESAARVDLAAVKELAYLMYSICERKGWSEAAMLFNALGSSWSDVAGAARSAPAISQQGALNFGDDDD